MGGRGSYATGNKSYHFETIGTIYGVKVVRKLATSNKTPEESYTSSAYIILHKDGSVKQFREFDSDHRPKLDIDFQEKFGKNERVLHIHLFKDGQRQPARNLTKKEELLYMKYFDKSKFKRSTK